MDVQPRTLPELPQCTALCVNFVDCGGYCAGNLVSGLCTREAPEGYGCHLCGPCEDDWSTNSGSQHERRRAG